MLKFQLAFFLVLVSFVSLGCGGGVATSTPVRVDRSPVVMPPGTFVPPSTATPFPTFTALPPVTFTPVPTPTNISVVVVQPDSTPVPTIDLASLVVAQPSPSPVVPPFPVPEEFLVPDATDVVTPLPTDSGLVAPPVVVPAGTPAIALTPGPAPTPDIPGYGVFDTFEDGFIRVFHHVLLPMQGRDIPSHLLTPDVLTLPPPSDFISRDVPYVLWMVFFETQAVPEDYEGRGYVQWIQTVEGVNPLVMYQEDVVVTYLNRGFLKMLGDDAPGLWVPAQYEVKLFDSSHREVVSWRFVVR